MAKCKGCGREIIWALNGATGKRVPLDAVAPVYLLLVGTGKHGENECVPAPAQTYVTHFATCSKANEFSGSKRKP